MAMLIGTTEINMYIYKSESLEMNWLIILSGMGWAAQGQKVASGVAAAASSVLPLAGADFNLLGDITQTIVEDNLLSRFTCKKVNFHKVTTKVDKKYIFERKGCSSACNYKTRLSK